jgi:F-type H+-transporting ATPase subunit b
VNTLAPSPLVLAAASGDWRVQMATQILAFLIFVWILKRYAWGPLTAMIDARKAAIEEQFDRIAGLEKDAKALEAQYAAKMKDIDTEARKHVQEAVGEGRRVRDEIIERARQEGEELREKQQRLLQLEVAKARIELRDEIVGMTIAATEKLLRENLDHDRQRGLVTRFLDEVEALPGGGDGGAGN